jgi:hypothetical protein
VEAREPLKLSAACAGWVQLAGHSSEADGDVLTLRGGPDTESWYQIRRRKDRRVELLECNAGAQRDEEELLLFALNMDVVERHLFAIFGDFIREDLGLPYLELPWAPSDLAAGFTLGDMNRGYRTLTLDGRGPVAAARDETLSLVALVPLSHLLVLDVGAVKSSFLDVDGRPLLDDGRYRQ